MPTFVSAHTVLLGFKRQARAGVDIDFSNSLIVHQVFKKEIISVRVFGYLILISTDFWRFYFSAYSSVLVSSEKIYQTLNTVFDHISKHLEVRQKYSAARRIFNSLLGVWKRSQTHSFVLDILRNQLCYQVHDWNESKIFSTVSSMSPTNTCTSKLSQ